MKKQITFKATQIAQLIFLGLMELVELGKHKTKNFLQPHRIQYILATLFVLTFVVYLIAPTIGSGGG